MKSRQSGHTVLPSPNTGPLIDGTEVFKTTFVAVEKYQIFLLVTLTRYAFHTVASRIIVICERT